MKNERQAKILEIVGSRNVETQEELLSLLQLRVIILRRLPYPDINELRLVKIPNGQGAINTGAKQCHQGRPPTPCQEDFRGLCAQRRF